MEIEEQAVPGSSTGREAGIRSADAGLTPSPAGAMGEQHTVEDVLRVLGERELPRGRGGPLTWAWIIAAPLLWWLAALTLFGAPFSEWTVPILLSLSTARLVASLSSQNCHRRAALLLPELDREWLGPLIESLAFANSTVRSIARLRLTTVLPTVDANTATRLSDAQRALLFDQVTPWNAATQPDLVEAILQFAARTEDELALDGANRLARLPGFLPSHRRIRLTARGVLPGLENQAAIQADRARIRQAIGPGPAPVQRAPDPVLSPQAQALLDEAEDDPKKQPAMRFVFLLAVWGIVFPYGVYQTVHQFASRDWAWGLLFAALTLLVSQAHRLSLTPQQVRVAARLASVDDVQAVGPLAEMVAWPDERIKVMAIAALTRLLPRLRASDTQLLSTKQRSLLYPTLRLQNARRHSEFLVALLGALEQVGDTEAIPYVQALANSIPSSLRQSRVVDAAKNCLPSLEGCAQQNRDSQVLLRATASDADESLLRPAGVQALSNPDILVRVARGVGEEAS